MERAEHQLRLIQAVYRVECVRQHGEALQEIRGRCEALLDMTAPKVRGDSRLGEMLDEIRQQLRIDVPSTPSPVA